MGVTELFVIFSGRQLRLFHHWRGGVRKRERRKVNVVDEEEEDEEKKTIG